MELGQSMKDWLLRIEVLSLLAPLQLYLIGFYDMVSHWIFPARIFAFTHVVCLLTINEQLLLKQLLYKPIIRMSWYSKQGEWHQHWLSKDCCCWSGSCRNNKEAVLLNCKLDAIYQPITSALFGARWHLRFYCLWRLGSVIWLQLLPSSFYFKDLSS